MCTLGLWSSFQAKKKCIQYFFLLFSCSEDLRRWFLQQEMDLFRYRFNELTENLMQKFLEHVNLSFEAVSMLLSVFVLHMSVVF